MRPPFAAPDLEARPAGQEPHFPWALAVLLLVVLASRLPFLGAGYGADPDAWRVALTAQRLATTGEYAPSRLLGHPVQEMASALVARGGPWALNGLTALFSAMGIGLFWLSMRALGYQGATEASLGLTFVPVYYVNSTVALDGVWALAFILASLYFVLVGRPVVAGACLGMAVGCRVTSGAMLLPLCVLSKNGRIRRPASADLLRLACPTVLVGAALYLPGLRRLGPGWSTLAHLERTFPSAQVVLRHATVEAWGTLGMLALFVGCGFLGGQWLLRRTVFLQGGTNRQLAVWVIAIAVYTAAFLAIPYKTRYLLPVVPFVVLALSMLLGPRCFRVVCALLVLSPFASIGPSGVRRGPILVDRAARIHGLALSHRLIALGKRMPPRSVIVVGWRLPQLRVLLAERSYGAIFVESLAADQLRRYLRDGFEVYYLPEMREQNRQYHRLDLATHGARPLPAVDGLP